ncbi:MAG: hypothetical protein Q9191_000893 [Dirinaria sp. TL-2023a]
MATWSSINLMNGYGPAETSVAAVVNMNVALDQQPTLIGCGIGVQCWLVDPGDHTRLVPPGCVAELAIEGPTLARGYLGDSERTSDSFVEVPFQNDTVDPGPGKGQLQVLTRRMYKTGDLVRYRTSDGMLYFLGRKDTQVKVHGQRVELGEIEHHLKAESAIRQSVVLLPKAGFCKQRLVAVISLQGVLSAENMLNANELQLVDRLEQDKAQPTIAVARQRLSSRLPTFMLPSIWLVVRSIPLLRSGKLDRKAILNRLHEMSEETYSQWIERGECDEKPATKIENQLRDFWGHALNLKPTRITLKNSWLALGGDSITAMMVQSQCKKNGIGLAVKDILSAKSITHLASLARTVASDTIQTEKIEEEFDLSPIQSLYFELPNRGEGHFNQSVFVRLARSIQPAKLHQAVKTIVGRHSMLRARFDLSVSDDEWKQRITTDVTGSHSFHVHKCSSKEDAIPLMSETQASLDLVNGPLFAVDTFQLENGSQLLFMTSHHLVIDLVSWRIILQDLEELLTSPQPAAPTEVSLSFQTWCAMQVEHSHKLPLQSLLPIRDIPTQSYAYWGMQDRPNHYGEVRREGFELDAFATDIIISKCHETMRTDTVDILIAAMLHSFSMVFNDRTAPTIFNEGHGREVWDQNIDLSRTVGWFTTMYPVYVDSAASGDFFDVLRRVKDFRRSVPANGRHYFASRMLTSKGSKRFASHWPLEITFNYLGVYQQLEREDSLLLPVEELAGEARGAGGNADVGSHTPRFGLFEISAVIAQGKLRFSFTFNRHMHHQERINSWISHCHDILITQPSRLAEMGYQPTLSDFPLLSLTYDKLEKLLSNSLPRVGILDIGNVEDIYRCSQIQQGLLISKQRDADVYAVAGVYKINSTCGDPVYSNRVADAWQKIVDRHASLRTLFVESSSQENVLYDQIVLRKIKANIVRLTCKTDADAIQLLRFQAPMEQTNQSPPHQLTICDTSAGSVFCRLEISHTIICADSVILKDGASMSIIFRELVCFYEGRFLHETGPLYSDYIHFLQSKSTHAGIGYWKTYLNNIEPTIFPKLDDAACVQRQLHSKHLQVDDLRDIQLFCDLHGLTMANVFHMAWAMLLRCYTGSDDVSYGYLMSVRDPSIQGIEDLVGYLVNMVVCRVVFEPETPLIATMRQVQTDLSDGQDHCQTALSEVLHALKLPGASLFNTSLSYRKVPLATASEQHAISFDDCFPYYDPTEYSVSINIEISDGKALVDLDYWTDCLSDGHANNVSNTFLQVLRTIVKSSELAVDQVQCVSDSDYQQISSWNKEMPETINKCVHEVIQERMVLHPNAAAIRAWDGNFTYAELNMIAGKLASYLKLLGIGPETYVCLCFEKSAYTIIAMLGVLQAGGAFVSLDPMHPTTALEMRIQDTKAPVILTSSCYQATFTGMGHQIVSIDRKFLDSLSAQPYLCTSVQPHNPCCVIYTSGSTGKPKGVVLEHRALVTSSEAHGSALGFGSSTKCLQFASYTFDNSLEEIFTTLMRGGTVCVPSDHDRFNDLAGAASRLEANFMDLTPTVATYLNPAEMPTIKKIGLGGEALTKTVLEVWGDAVEVHNQYGPSECSINATHRTDIRGSSDASSIGRSVGSVSWIVDPSDHRRLVAIGCEGELAIEGPILARGYLNDPEKTAQVFIDNPLNGPEVNYSNAPRRMYKTGDLVRYNSDGTICYIGRKDQQVKLNGQRIELGEIEYHVRIHLETDWHFAVELIRPGDNQTSTKALALFLCPQNDSNASATVPEDGLMPMSTTLRDIFQKLEASLAGALPKHMVPTLFIPLARIPLTSSGKLDRKQLQAMANSMTENQTALFRLAGATGREPSTEIEKTLAQLWESVLSLPAGSIGMDAQFFRMGADSIAAIRLVTAARSKNINLTVADIFRNATLSRMCENAYASDALDQKASTAGPKPFELLPATLPLSQMITDISELCKVAENDIEDVYPATAIQEGLIVSSDKQPGAYVAHNVYRLPSIDLDKFKAAWEAVVAAEAILRTRIVYMENLGFFQVVINEKVDWCGYENVTEIPDAVRIKPTSNGASLTAYAIAGGSENEACFVWTIHHSLYDGWSFELVLDKVEAHYNGAERLEAADVPSYSQFMQYLTSIDGAASEDFWRSRLADTASPQYPMLPKSTYQPRVTDSFSHFTSVPQNSGGEYTMPCLIRAAWALTISAYSNSDDVTYAETVNGRDAPIFGIVDMIGPAFATIPVRVRTNSELTIAEFLTNVQGDCTEAMPFQYMGLQRIKRLSSDTAKACEFQNLISINSGDSGSDNDFWKPEQAGTSATDFFTYALTISFDVSNSGVKATAYFDSEVIPLWQIQKLFDYFGCTLTRLSESDRASSRLCEIQTITNDDRTLIKRWNTKPYAVINRGIHDMIQERVNAAATLAPALCSWDANLTYSELDNLANSLARHLQELGLGHRSKVPVCFEKSALAVIAMLAILKIGASFVAIDGSSPNARLQSIIADVDAKCVLSSSKYKEVCESLGVKVHLVEMQNVARLPQKPTYLASCSPNDIAYIVFTSGSTGKPKGTLVSHTAFVSGATAHGPAMRMQSTSRVLQFASYTFDASMVEIFTTLMFGGCVCIPDERARLNDITKVINDMNVTWALLTPSFVQMITPSSVPSLDTLVLGGESMTRNNLAIWAGKTHLINAYGPSECAVVATVNPNVCSTSQPSNIGRAVSSHCFIVNQHRHDQLVPVGAVGELVVVGPILASGYQKNPLKTAESFVSCPECVNDLHCSPALAKPLMYKTGDLVKYDEDGSLLYVGRKDSQTKLHGQRLELGEVEYHMGQVQDIKHALAVVPTHGLCEKKLVGVLSLQGEMQSGILHQGLDVVAAKESELPVKSAREYLSNHLPPYMVCSNWVVLQEIPLLPSGKLDRRRIILWLEEMTEDDFAGIFRTGRESFDIQGSEIEQHLQRIWSKVLHLPMEQIGLDNSFYFLGGDSLAALQVSSQCRAAGLGVTVQDIIRCQSISDLACRVTLPQNSAFAAEEFEKLFSLAPIQKLFFEWVGDHVNYFNQSMVVTLTEKKEPETVSHAIQELSKVHSMLNASFEKSKDGVWMQKLTRRPLNSHHFVAHAGTYSPKQMSSLIEASQKNLDVTNGPLYRADLFEFGESGSQVLSLVVHHLVVDVVSWGIILEDLEGLLVSGKTTTQLSLPFQSWSRLQDERVSWETSNGIYFPDEVATPDFAYWGMSERPNVYGDVSTLDFAIDEETTTCLLGPCHRSLQTDIVDVLLGCILHSFCRAFSDRESIPAVFNEGHGREPWDAKLDLTNTVGWFTTISPIFVPTEARQEQEVTRIIRWVKDQRARIVDKGRQYFAHRMLAEDSKTDFASHWPMEIAFNYLGHENMLKKSHSLLQPVNDSLTNFDIGSSVPRFALFELSASISEHRLKLSLDYNKNMKYQPRIRHWVTELENSLRSASQLLMKMEPQATLDSFPLLPLRYGIMESLRERLSAIGLESIGDIENVYGCSPIQRGLLLSQIKDNGQYMYQSIFTVSSANPLTPVDPSKLANAWRKVVAKHSALRTIFIKSLSQEGLMDQAVLKHVSPNIVPLSCDSSNAVKYLKKQEPLTFVQGQLPHRLTIAAAAEGRLYCKLEMSHSIVDGTSIPIIFRDLTDFCAESQDPGDKVLPYSDYIAYINKSSHESDIAYWHRYLENVEPCYFPALGDSTEASKQLQTVELDIRELPELHSFCSKNSVTLSNALQFVWALVLRAYTGRDDVCFGYLHSGRDVPLENIESAVGIFISMLICRIDCDTDTPVRSALEQIRDDHAQGTNHQAFYLGDLQHKLQLSSKSIFNTAFTYQRRPDSGKTGSQGIALDILDAYDPSEYDLTVNVEAYETGISIHFNYWTHCLDDGHAQNILETFDQILNSMLHLDSSEQGIGALEACGESHKRKILEWNEDPLPILDECVHDVIYQRGQSLLPTSPAVCSWDLDLTFPALLDLSRRLSKHLVALGVGPEVYVPLCFEKTTWAIVGMLGVLFAGGAFVALEPSHPESRIKYILNSVNARLILCSSKYEKRFTEYPEVATFIVDKSLNTEPKPVLDNVSVKVTPDNTAYLIFTSGTTGLPKGTIISHRAFATSATEHASAIAMREGSRVMQFSNLCFDASIMEILTTLIVGGCICIPSEEERMNDIPGAINRMSVNWTLLTPSVADILEPETVPSLKVLVTGGEAMQARHIAKWRGKVILVNAYGPSECAVIATTSIKVDEYGFVMNDESAVIGRAVGCRSWVVHPQDHSQLMPIGSIGELVLQGNTVARGYLNEKEKTAKAFVPPPAWMTGLENGQDSDPAPERRIYKTGDLVRYNSDGNLVYISRKDTQIKLNGLRIELGEIEHRVKEKLPENIQTAVEMVAPADQRPTLAVFFTDPRPAGQLENLPRKELPEAKSTKVDLDPLLLPMSEQAASLCKALKNNLTGALPAYMIPSLYIPLERIPWTTSGKLDRSRLCKIVSQLPKEMMAPFKLANVGQNRAPTTAMEKSLQKLWETNLKLAPGSVTLDDNYLAVGGDSVQAMKLVAAAREEQILLSVQDVFRRSNFSEMANACTCIEDEGESSLKPFALLNRIGAVDQLIEEIVAQCQIEKDELADAYPCTALQEGLVTLSIKQPGAYVAHNVFRLPKALDIDQFKAAWETAVGQMDILRTRIIRSDTDVLLQAVLKQEHIKWHHAQNVEAAIQSQKQLPERNGAPLMRLVIVDEKNLGQDRFFVWSIHHSLYDGWSMPRMLQRVEEIYFDESPPVPKASYAQFIRYLSDTDSKACNEFWQSKFEGLQCSHFPTISALNAGQNNRSKLLSYTVQLPQRPAMSSITLPTMIRAAWAILLSAHTGSDDVVFGETMTGRDIPIHGVIDMVGPTLTTVPSRIRTSASCTIAEFLQSIHRMATDVIPYQHTGLQNIRRLGTEAARACDFQNLLIIQTAGAQDESKMWHPQGSGVSSDFFTYPLVIECNMGGSSIHVDAHYDETMLSKWLVQRLLYQLESILGQLFSSPPGSRATLDDIQVISEQDVDLIAQWNDYHPIPVKRCIHNLFLQRAEATPQTQAVCAWDGTFTYAELRTNADILSKRLIRLGVAPEVLIPFCMDKSRWAIVAQLAVLMAGGAIVPLDPSHPMTRHSEILKDTNAKIILCSPQYQSRYAEVVETVIPVDEQTMVQGEAIIDYEASVVQVSSTNTAYVIFTSGSTGRPKGVVVEHEAFCTSSEAFCAAMLMDINSRVFNFASVTFDVGLMENLSPLTLGACVCLPNNEGKMDVDAAIAGLSATWAFLTPSVASLIDPTVVPSLKTLVCGGEALSQDNVLKWADRVQLVNGYGPTEAAVISVANSRVTQSTDPSNIGFAHTNGRAWIADLNNHNRLAPLGCVGELLLGGPILAREYLHDEAKTAAAFIATTTWAKNFEAKLGTPGRIYKTGDVVRYNEDGSIAFIGRRDNQVKLHGQRMELGEIESKFALHDQIRHGVALLPKEGLCKERLVAVVSMSDPSLASKSSASNACELLQGEPLEMAQAQLDKVRESLSDQLPAYMMPTVWVIMAAIPILVSGKLDRKQVEKWIHGLDEVSYQHIVGDERGASGQAPITETVQRLREVWASVFNIAVDKIDPGRSFMSQGGDSLISMSIIARCRKIGINLSLQEVLQSKSLFQLGTTLDSRGYSTKNSKTLFAEEKVDKLFELSPVQRLYFELAGSSSDYTKESRFNQSQLLRFNRKTEAKAIQNAVRTIVQQHSMLRARFQRDMDGNWRQRITISASESHRFREHQVNSPSDLLRVLSESQSSLDLENGPLFAVELLHSPQHGQILSLIAHHLIIDVVSWNIMLQQLEDLLTLQTERIEKPLSFQVWSALQNDSACRRDPSTIKKILPFRVQKPDLASWGMLGRSNLYADVEHASFQLNKSHTELVVGKSNKALQTQPIELFQSALLHSFRSVFQRRAMPTIFNESHGRDTWDTAIDPTETIGWFTSIYPIAIAQEDVDLNSIDILKRVKDLRRSLQANGREYFAHRFLTPDGRWRFGDHMPIEILLNYTGQSKSSGGPKDALLQPFDLVKSREEETRTADVGPAAVRMALFEISVAITNGQARFSFMWNRHMEHQPQIQQWVSKCRDTLTDLVVRLADHRREPTLSDFPLLPTDYSGLAKHVDETFHEIGISTLDEVEDMYICAPTQEGLLLSQIRNPTQYVNFVISEVQLAFKGAKVDVQRMARAWQKVVDRHQSLRTAFVYSVCKSHAFDQIAMKYAEGGAVIVRCDDSEWENELGKISLREVNRTRRPMLPQQLSICMTNSGRCYIKLELNHAVIDGESGALITRDLALAYQGRLPDGSKPLYSDYVKFISSRDERIDAAYWKNYLDGIRRCHLPPIRPEPKEATRLNIVDFQFDRFAELQAFCRANELTLSNVMLAGWGLVLRHYTSMNDVCFGNLTAGRDAPVDGIQDTVGAFINMLVCRVTFEHSRSIKDIVRNVQSDYLESLPHQHCSLAKLQHDLGFSREPLFNTAVSIQNQISSKDAEREGDTIEIEPIAGSDPTEYAITVNVRSALGDEGARIEHWTSHISIPEAEKLSRTYANVLGSILDNADQPMSKFVLAAEREVDGQASFDGSEITSNEHHHFDDSMSEDTQAGDDSSSNSGSLVNPEDFHSQDYRGLVKQCVHEVLQQMFKSDDLSVYMDKLQRATELVEQKLGGPDTSPDYERPLKSASFDDEPKTHYGAMNRSRGSESILPKLRALWSPLVHMPEKKIRDDDTFFELGE